MYTKQLDTFYGIANSDLFGAAGGGSLKGVNALAIYNGSSLADVGINTRSQGCGAASGDNFMIPASSGLVIEHVMIGKVICARSLGSSLVVGNLYISVW